MWRRRQNFSLGFVASFRRKPESRQPAPCIVTLDPGFPAFAEAKSITILVFPREFRFGFAQAGAGVTACEFITASACAPAFDSLPTSP